MTLAVQCPQCLTAFKVVQDQLKVAQGWVKCGRCQQVFNAHSHGLELDEIGPTQDSGPVVHPSTAMAEPLAPADAPGEGLQPDASTPDTIQVSSINPTAIAQGMDASEFGMPLAERAAPRSRRIWTVLIGVLGLLLAAQMAWWNKSQWLAHWPQAHEWVQAACAQGRCQMDWPHGLDAVMIERAHFEPDGEGHHRLQIQLSNRAQHTVATPWLDLTLTDDEDRIVIRRMLAPQEMGLPQQLSPNMDVVSSVYWRVDSDVEDRLSGYRAEIFYP
ncbi:MAG: DUF3426 domain-containing protein [Betaproteobacteria bacterium]|nr:DUF3426 domain-containing protein [Betaproteobacteria bacterium]NBY04512.1 DUF3426 domain-containing protein [Betaproteobacteria bacterium]